MVSSSSTDKSVIVGRTFGLKLDVMMSSEHLRKPKKANMNIMSSVSIDGVVALAQGGDKLGEYV